MITLTSSHYNDVLISGHMIFKLEMADRLLGASHVRLKGGCVSAGTLLLGLRLINHHGQHTRGPCTD
jgi:hypothetical protein